MRKIILIIPFLLFGRSLMHPDDPKSRDHNSLGFGATCPEFIKSNESIFVD